jgi:tripartite-type tricarboxylate transporter receptor subunit TctC
VQSALPRRRRRELLLVATSPALSLLPNFAYAQAFPEKTITLVVPNVAGGGADMVARSIAQQLSRRFKQSVVVENVPGAGGVLALQKVLRAAPDGHTLLLANNDLVTTLVASPNPGYSLKDVTPLVRLALTPLVLVARAGLEARNFDEMVDLARRSPGKLTAGTTGTTSIAAIAVAMMERTAGIKLQTVPYKGGAQALVDLAGGVIDLVVTAAPVGLAQVSSGKIKALGVLADKRLAVAPEVGSASESRQMKGLHVDVWAGLVGPAKMPVQAVSAIRGVLSDILKDPEYQEEVRKRGDLVTEPMLGEDFAGYIRQEEAKVREVSSRLKID